MLVSRPLFRFGISARHVTIHWETPSTYDWQRKEGLIKSINQQIHICIQLLFWVSSCNPAQAHFQLPWWLDIVTWRRFNLMMIKPCQYFKNECDSPCLMHELSWPKFIRSSFSLISQRSIVSSSLSFSAFSILVFLTYWSKPLSPFSSGSAVLAMAICNPQTQIFERFAQKAEYLINKVSSYLSLFNFSLLLLNCIYFFKIVFYFILQTVPLHPPFQVDKKVNQGLPIFLYSATNSAGQHDGSDRQQD